MKKWALITGANGGIGKALVEEFVGSGYHVIATDRGTSAELARPEIVQLPLDLESITNSAHVAAAFHRGVLQASGGAGISALVNNAALQILGHSSEITRKDWSRSFNVNVHAPFLLIQLFEAELTRNEGSVVNISSIHATQTKERFVTYATTKGALSSLTRNLAVDLKDRIRINAIEPAAVGTEMLRAGFEGDQGKLAELEATHPISRIARPEEIAQLTVFLCSQKARFVHGACISASGGIAGSLNDPG